MLFPTCDGGDIDSVVCQVGLDGIALFEDDGARCGSEMTAHRYEMDKISKWRLADPTILTVKVAGRDGISSLSLSSDDATCAAMMDTMVTSAFQWCELRGHDPSDTIGDDGAGEWVNKKALVSASGASSSSLNADTRTQVAAAVAAVQIAWHDAPEYCGWLTKKGEHLSMWRRRWFVLKDKKLGWFKDVNQANKPNVRPRGVIDLGKVISVCTATHADAGRAHGVELIGSVEAEKAGCKFLCADSEREGDGWATKLAEVCNDAAPTTEQSQPAPGFLVRRRAGTRADAFLAARVAARARVPELRIERRTERRTRKWKSATSDGHQRQRHRLRPKRPKPKPKLWRRPVPESVGARGVGYVLHERGCRVLRQLADWGDAVGETRVREGEWRVLPTHDAIQNRSLKEFHIKINLRRSLDLAAVPTRTLDPGRPRSTSARRPPSPAPAAPRRSP
jgi:hypothetical protein